MYISQKESDYDCEYSDLKREHSVDMLLQQVVIIKNKNAPVSLN